MLLHRFRDFFKDFFYKIFYELEPLKGKSVIPDKILQNIINSTISSESKIYGNCYIVGSNVGEFTYIGANSHLSNTDVGKFCSIGPNLMCGYGIHPLHGISTSPMFYSLSSVNGTTLSTVNKIQETKRIDIGNDVWIGMNCTILDGVSVGHGAVIAAGAVVTKNVEPYSIVGGVPAKEIKKRFSEEQIKKLLLTQWWDFPKERLHEIENNFFNVDQFLNSNEKEY